MSVYRPIRVEFWTDEKVVEQFSPEDKYFMLYLLTNPHTNQLGIYNFVNKIAAFELGYSVEAVSVLLDRFENKYNIIVRSKSTNEIAILNYLLHSVISGGKPLEDCINKDMKSVKDKLLIDNVFAYLCGKDISPTINNIINNYFNIINTEQEHKQEHKHKQKVADNTSTIRGQYVDNTQKDDKEPELPNIYKNVVDYLNKKADTNFKHTSKATQTKIKARQNDGYALNDFYAVIDVKCSQWLNDKTMSKYLRPETLFGNKFESYLNEKRLDNTQQSKEQTDLERLKETDPIEYEKYRPAT